MKEKEKKKATLFSILARSLAHSLTPPWQAQKAWIMYSHEAVRFATDESVRRLQNLNEEQGCCFAKVSLICKIAVRTRKKKKPKDIINTFLEKEGTHQTQTTPYPRPDGCIL